MSQNIALLRRLQPLLQATRGLLLRIVTNPASDHRATGVTMEPYMDALPTRRPLPRPTRARQLQGFMQMSMDAAGKEDA